MSANWQMVDALKRDGLYFIAGALAKAIGCSRSYGCHFGMRSEYDRAQRMFFAGYDHEAG